MRYRRRSIFLLEVLIGTALLSLLVGGLMFFMVQVVRLHARLQVQQRQCLPQHQMRVRLIQIFSSLVPSTEGGESMRWDAEHATLHILWDHGIDPDPEFSGIVRSKLYVQKGQWILEIMPLEEGLPGRKELLHLGVQRVTYLFFSSRWEPSWDLPELPKMVRVGIWDEEKHCEWFAFFIPAARIDQVSS